MDSYEGSRRSVSRSVPDRRMPPDPEAIEQRLERWVSAGRQLVDGVSGSRPGSRASQRRQDGRDPSRAALDRGRNGGFQGLGRWVEDKLDWLIEDGDDWREPWQEGGVRRAGGPVADQPRQPQAEAVSAPAAARRRRPLEALSRRGQPRPDPGPAEAEAHEAWPEDDSFSVPRWQRPAPVRRGGQAVVPPPLPSASASAAREPGELDQRPLPRSSRRR